MPKTMFKSDFYEIIHQKIGIQALSETFFRFQVTLLVPILCYFLLWQLRKIILYLIVFLLYALLFSFIVSIVPDQIWSHVWYHSITFLWDTAMYVFVKFRATDSTYVCFNMAEVKLQNCSPARSLFTQQLLSYYLFINS